MKQSNHAPDTTSGLAPGPDITKALVAPLRKRRLTGELYVRDPKVETAIAELSALPREELLARAVLTNRSDARYVPGECLVHFIRASRDELGDGWFERLYRILVARVLRSVPRPETQGGTAVSLTRERVRDAVLGRFVELLVSDRTSYQEKLDFFEVRFDGAVASLRRDAQRQAWRDENRSEPPEFDHEGAEVSPEVEAAAHRQDPGLLSELDDPVYRSQLDAAIDALPNDQRRIIHMLSQGVPIDSKEPDVLTIAKALGRSEKTIRNNRDKAFAALRSAIQPGGNRERR